MENIKVPTDNMYKFLAVTGLVIFISSLTLHIFNQSTLRKEYSQAYKDQYESTIEMNLFKHYRDNQPIEVTNTEERKKIPYDDSFGDLEKTLKLKNEASLNVWVLEKIKKEMRNSKIIYALISSLSLIMMFVGFYKWYFKLQKFEDIRVEKISKKIK